MKHMDKNRLRFGIVMAGLAVLGWLIISKALIVDQNPVKEVQPKLNPKSLQVPLRIGSYELRAEVRRTAAEQELGLSWREFMGEDEAMVFVYEKPQKVLYWMKGMQFPLDFIWVAGQRVIEVSENISHPTQEQPMIRTVAPEGEVDMVIEVNAGWVNKHQVKAGDMIELKEF